VGAARGLAPALLAVVSSDGRWSWELLVVIEILGHSPISTTSDIYTHVMPAQYNEVADVLDAWLGHEDGDGQGDEDDQADDL
jgi:hypothetical protein